MPSLADQMRWARRRRARRRRALSVVVVMTAVLLGARLATGANDEPAGAASATTTVSTAPSTTAAPTGLQPGLVYAFQRAQASAAKAGHNLTITSGFRTAAEQSAMLEAEIAERGSREQALWWVFPPERSMHVQGLAVDVGDGPAADWLSKEGARFGLCRTLSWEWWHFEWRARWEATGACPAPAKTPADAPPP